MFRVQRTLNRVETASGSLLQLLRTGIQPPLIPPGELNRPGDSMDSVVSQHFAIKPMIWYLSAQRSTRGGFRPPFFVSGTETLELSVAVVVQLTVQSQMGARLLLV